MGWEWHWFEELMFEIGCTDRGDLGVMSKVKMWRTIELVGGLRLKFWLLWRWVEEETIFLRCKTMQIWSRCGIFVENWCGDGGERIWVRFQRWESINFGKKWIVLMESVGRNVLIGLLGESCGIRCTISSILAIDGVELKELK